MPAKKKSPKSKPAQKTRIRAVKNLSLKRDHKVKGGSNPRGMINFS